MSSPAETRPVSSSGAVNPARAIELGHEQRAVEQVARIDPWNGAGQFAIGDQASSGREELKAGAVSGRADGIEHGSAATPLCPGTHGLRYVLDGSVDDVGRSGGASGP